MLPYGMPPYGMSSYGISMLPYAVSMLPYAILILVIIISAIYLFGSQTDNILGGMLECLAIVAVVAFLVYSVFNMVDAADDADEHSDSADDAEVHGGSADDAQVYGGSADGLDHYHSDLFSSDNITGGKDANKYMRMDLMDPKHNLREIAKQMILLEDHMSHRRKRCVDCITKHYLMIEALLEEAITLDETSEHINELNDIIEKIKPVMMNVISDIKSGKMKNQLYADTTYHKASQELRNVRKQIGLKYVLNN